MIPASQAYVDAVAQTSRSFRARFLDENDNVIEGSLLALSYWTGACSDKPQPGGYFSPYAEATMDGLAQSIYGQEIQLQIGVITDQLGSIEYVTVGTFKAAQTQTTGTRTTFKAVGTLTWAGGLLYSSELTYPASLSSVISEIASQSGMTIITKGLTVSGTLEKAITGLTYTGALTQIASLLGGFVTEDRQGQVVLAAYGSGDTYAMDMTRVTSRPSYTEQAYTVTGITCIVTGDSEDEGGQIIPGISYTYGTPNVTIVNPYMTQALFNVMAPRYTGLTFYPATVPLTLGNPLLEPWDVLSITDTDGTVRTVPCHLIESLFTGGFSQQITAALSGDSDESDTPVIGPLSQQIAEVNYELLTAKQAILARATIAQLNAAIASIDVGYINKAIIGDAEVTDLTATKAQMIQLLVNQFTAQEIQAIMLDFDQATGGSLTLDELDADRATLESLLAGDFTATQIEAIAAAFSEVATTSLVAESLTTQYAKIDFANIGVETVSELFVNTGFLTNATIQDGKITGTLGAVQVVADLIEVNTIIAGDLLVQSQDDPDIYYRINLEESQVTREDIPADQMSQYLSGNDIIAHSITAREITAENLKGTGGWINLAEGTFKYANPSTGQGVSWDGSQFQILSGEGSGDLPIITAWVDTSEPAFSADWLVDENGDTITPASNTIYLLQSAPYTGDYYLWNGTAYADADLFANSMAGNNVIAGALTAGEVAQKTSSIRYENGKLILSDSTASFSVVLDNQMLAFYQGSITGDPVAYISNNQLFIPYSVVLNALDVGSWRWKKQNNGNLTLQWIGG